MNKALLVILDGFGYSPKIEHNAIALGKTTFIDHLFADYPHSLLQTSGEAVGLPEGIMGNSEVGHLTMGAGRVIYQDLSLISKFAREGKFATEPEIAKLLNRKNPLHLIGLLSDGGVHSHIDHWIALIQQIAKKDTAQEIYLHPFMDGRDTPPRSGVTYLSQIEKVANEFPNVKIASICGRFFAMDRDKRWDRVEKAYRMLSEGVSDFTEFSNANQAIQAAYELGETDEFVLPRKIQGGKNIEVEDSVIFLNFRADRAREISMAFCDRNFSGFTRNSLIKEEQWVTFSSYSEDFHFPVIFSKEMPRNTLGELVSKNGGIQLRIAETEKYAHVTYFFSGGNEDMFKGEDRILVESPKDVATYDLKPEMSAFELSDKLIEAIENKPYDFVVINYANGDMVGHTGNEQAAIDAVETLDQCMKKIIPVAQKLGYEILITADHGNCEQMLDEETGEEFTQHTTNPVPLIWVGENAKGGSLKDGSLADIAPSILKIMGINIPREIEGQSLLA